MSKRVNADVTRTHPLRPDVSLRLSSRAGKPPAPFSPCEGMPEDIPFSLSNEIEIGFGHKLQSLQCAEGTSRGGARPGHWGPTHVLLFDGLPWITGRPVSPPNSHGRLNPQLQNVALFVNRLFKEVTELK